METTLRLAAYGTVVLVYLVILFVEASADFLTMYGTVVLYGLVFLVVESVQILVVYPRITRVKGWTPPSAKLLIAICIMLGVVLFVLLFLADVLVLDRENRGYRAFGYEVVAAGFICAISLAVTARLPQQETRKSGPRRVLFPYQFFGTPLVFFGEVLLFVFFAPLLIGLVFSLILWDRQILIDSLGLMMMLLLPLWPVGYLSMKWGNKVLDVDRMANLPDGLEVLRSDNRPPILFLRAFRHDTESFIDTYLCYSTNPYYDIRAGRPPMHFRETFEQFLAGSVKSRLGPFLALGNPEDYVPPSDEATRIYFSDMEWFDGFQRFARESACILMQVSISDSLDKELQFILNTGLQTKLYILTPPETSDLGNNVLGSQAILDNLSSLWPKFAGMLNRLGYNAPEDHVPNGAIIVFDSDGKAEVMVTDAKSAADYIGAIESRLLSNEVKA